jgi:hypothetical protein
MMRAPILLLLSPFVCLGVVALTSLIIFLAMWRGKQAVLQRLADAANAAANGKESPAADSRWTHTSLSDIRQTDSTIETSPCPACGGENFVSAGACAYCGRKL